jgi:dCTP deaminase
VAILADRDILSLRREGRFHLEPFREENLTPNGYDLTVAEVYVPRTGLRAREGRPEVPPTTWFAVGTLEVVELDASLVGQLWIRTSWARRGVLASFGHIDAGFRGNLTLGAFNGSHEVLVVPMGETFAQLVLEEMSSPAKGTYDERSGRYQDQRGVTMAKDQPP